MRGVLLLIMTLVLLVACQADDEATGPRTIVDWQPAPGSPLPPPADGSLPTPLPAAQRPELLEPEPAEPAAPLEVPELGPTPAPYNTYVSEGSGFAVPFSTNWEIVDSNDQGVSAYDPSLGVFVTAYMGFMDDSTSYDATLEMFLEDEEGYLGDLSLAAEEDIVFAGDGAAKAAMLTGVDSDGADVGLWFAYAEDGSHHYTFTAYGNPGDLQARQTTMKTIVSLAEPGGANLYGYDRSETLVLLGNDPLAKQLDPARQTGSAAGYIGLLYSGLVRLAPDMLVEPDLAESWEISPDGTEYTFFLRDDIAFHSGKPITAADFQYSWERVADPETDSTTAATYMGDILGLPEKLSGEAQSISGIEVIDDRTLKVTLDAPKPYFLLKLTYPTSYVVDEESVDPEDEEWVFEPNASGPYTLAEIHEETAVIFERNDNYHTPPSIPNVIQLLYRVGSRSSLFEFGEVDIVAVGGNDVRRVREPEDELHDNWVSTTSLCTSLVMLNNSIPPLDDPNVRRALALAVDKEALNELLNEDLNLVAESILPPAMPGYSAEAVQQRAEGGYDPEAAEAALAASTYASGLPAITLVDGGYGTTENPFLNALIADWQEVLGAEVVVEYVDPQDFSRAARESGGHIVAYGWCADYPDPENFLDILFHTGSDFNVAGYSNPEIDALLEEARVELDPTRRLAMYQEIEAALIADAATIPLDHGVSDALVSSRVQGYVLSPMGSPIIHRLSLEPVEEGE